MFVSPWEELELSVDWTRNEFEHAGQIDDNLNHLGFLVGWSPYERLTVGGRYILSWAIDVTHENAGGGAKFASHHNLFGLVRWHCTDDSHLELQFGEAYLAAETAPAFVFSTDPFGDSYPTLDTEHLVRLIYSLRF